ncbi:MAG: hypothetical protein WC829_00445 [Hyphomicrobium sp.]|jgi:hypothetical protein
MQFIRSPFHAGSLRDSMPPAGYVVILGALGSWAAFNGILFALDSAKRYRAEAAWFLFTAALIITAVVAVRKGIQRDTTVVAPTSLSVTLVGAAVAIVSALLLYYPALSIGLLSDDFVLLSRAKQGVLAELSWEYLRPLPLALWRLLATGVEASDIPWRLHAFSIALHGVNAALVAALAARLGLARLEAWIAGALFLVFPGAVEPVVWASGIFDITVVLFMLAACVAVATTHGVTQVVIAAVLTTAALASKEVGVVLPILLAITAWVSPHSTLRQARVAVAASFAIVGTYVLIRVIGGFATAPPLASVSGYVVKEMLSRPFGFLGLPFHSQLLATVPWLVLAFALWWPAVLVGSAISWWTNARNARLVLALGLWVVVTVAPLGTMLFVSDDLQGSRYLYAGAAAWAVITVAVVRWLPNRLSIVLTGVLVVGFLIVVRAHLSPWLAAAAERDRVLTLFRQANLDCTPTDVVGLPDHIRGAYVLRNGFVEAATTDSPAGSGEPCMIEFGNDAFHKVEPSSPGAAGGVGPTGLRPR